MATISPLDAPSCGDYRLLTKLGEGGMGEVHLAEHRTTGRRCAIKFLRADRAADSAAADRFQAEFQALENLDHPHAVRVFEQGAADDGRAYYVMEYLPGRSLDDVLSSSGPLPPEYAASLLRSLCSVLAEVHRLGMVHRDVKPANIMVGEGSEDAVTLFDFGLVKTSDAEHASESEGESAFSGSPHYAPPEAAGGSDAIDVRSDIYSLGATAYHLLAGQPVFPGNDPVSVIFAHADQQPAPPSVRNADVPPALDAIVMKCLEKRPDDRFQSMAELDDALRQTGLADRWTSELARQWSSTRSERSLPIPDEPATAATCVNLGETK